MAGSRFRCPTVSTVQGPGASWVTRPARAVRSAGGCCQEGISPSHEALARHARTCRLPATAPNVPLFQGLFRGFSGFTPTGDGVILPSCRSLVVVDGKWQVTGDRDLVTLSLKSHDTYNKLTMIPSTAVVSIIYRPPPHDRSLACSQGSMLRSRRGFAPPYESL